MQIKTAILAGTLAILASSCTCKADHGASAIQGMGMWNLTPHLVIRPPKPDPVHKRFTPEIQNAETLPVWKQPYAYGYFGARRGHCFPTRSFGHQQSYTEWRFR